MAWRRQHTAWMKVAERQRDTGRYRYHGDKLILHFLIRHHDSPRFGGLCFSSTRCFLSHHWLPRSTRLYRKRLRYFNYKTKHISISIYFVLFWGMEFEANGTMSNVVSCRSGRKLLAPLLLILLCIAPNSFAQNQGSLAKDNALLHAGDLSLNIEVANQHF